MVDAGIVKATFILVSKNMTKGMQDITRGMQGLNKASGEVGTSTGKMGKTLTEAEKIVKNLEKNTAMYTHQVRKDLNATNLSNAKKQEFIQTHRKLRSGLESGSISIGQYNKSMKTLAGNYGLVYKNGKIFDQGLVSQQKNVKTTSKLMKDLFLKTQLTTPDKVFGKSTNIEKFNRQMAIANKEVQTGSMRMGEYNNYRRTLAKINNLTVKNNGFVYDNQALSAVNNKMRTYIKLHDSMILSKQRGIPINSYHNNLLNKSKIGLQELEGWKKAGIISQGQYNNILSRTNGSYERVALQTKSLNKSYGTLANSTNMVSRSQRMQNYALQVSAMRYNAVGLAISSMAGLMVGLYLQNFTMARMQSIKLDQQMQQFFATMKLGQGALQDFNKALDEYVAKAPKVNKYALGATIGQVGKLNNLTLDEMKKMIPVVADIQSMMVMNGRSMEDATLAINDAFDGQFKRLQEIGVQGKEHLQKYGYDGTAQSLVSALEKIGQEKGWSDLTRNITTASDAFQILGNAIDRIIVPTVNFFTPAIVALSKAIADLFTWLSSLNPVVSGLVTTVLIAGGAFATMKLQMAWARLMGSEMMAGLTGLDQGMQRVTNTLFSAREVTSMLPAEFDSTAINMAKMNHQAKTGTDTWGALTASTQNELLTVQKAKLQYDTLTRTQKAQIQTLMRMKDVSKEEAMIQLFGADAVNANTLAKSGNLAPTETGIWASMKATWARTMESASTDKDTASKGANTVATVINTQAKNLATKATQLLAKATLFLKSTAGIATIAIVAVIGVIYLLTETQRKGIQTMKEYNDFMDNGEEKIEKLKNASESYKNKAKELEEQRDRMADKGMNTVNIEDQIAQAYKNSALMAQEAKNAEEALRVGREKGDEIEARNLVDRSSYLNKQNDLLRERGIIDDVAYENGKLYNSTVLAGTEKMYEALQRTNRIRNIGEMQTEKIVNGEHEYSRAFLENQEKGGHAIEDRIKAYDELAEAKYKAETSDDWMTSASAWFEQGIVRLKIGWIDTVMQWENFKITLGGIYNDLVAWWDGLVAYLQGAWNNTVKFFSDIWTAIVTPLENAWSSISGFFTGIWDKIFGGIDGGGLGETIGNFFSNIDFGAIWDNFINTMITLVSHYNPVTLITVMLFGEEAGYEMQYQIEAYFRNIYDFFMLGLTNLIGWITDAWNGFVEGINWVWTSLVTTAQNTWNTIVTYTQIAWNLVYTYIYTPIFNVYTFVIGKLTNIYVFIVGVWNNVKNTTLTAWNNIKNTIFNTMNPIWAKISSITGKIKDAWNDMKNKLVEGAKTIYDKVWVGFLEPLKKRLEEFVHFITHPFGGGGGGSGGNPGSAGSPGSAGFSGFAGSTPTLRTNNGISTSKSNNVFSGLGSAIVNQARSMVDSTGIPLDPRFNYAGTPEPSAGRLIKDPHECELKYGEDCYAGWDTAWIDGIINRIKSWSMSIYGSTMSLMDLANGEGSLKIFEAVASRLIGGTHYQFYYNGAKSNEQALRDRAFNCWDGAEILIDLAKGLGLNASMGHGTWNGIGHVWAVVNGKPFDTTAFQHGHGWTSPSVRGYAGGGSGTNALNKSNLKIELNFEGATFIGMDDVKRQMTDVANDVFTKVLGKNPAIGF